MKTLSDKLNIALANSYVLYLKTQNYHWNVKGSNFRSLHLMFQEQYTDLALAIDEIAERIVTLEEHALGSFKDYLALTSMTEATGTNSKSSTDMLKDLLASQEIIIKSFQESMLEAEKTNDDVTIDLCIHRISVHQKNIWMLKSSI